MPQYPPKRFPVGWIAAFLFVAALVAAIIFPMFQKVREGSRSDYCQSNMRRLGLALIQYSQDFDENFPQGMNKAGNGWAGQLYSFTKNTQVYQCTKDPQQGNYVSYTENRNIAGLYYGNMVQPAATVALYEFSTLNCDPSTPEAVSATGLNAPQDSTRHDGEGYGPMFGLNFLMTDGHVKWLTPEKVSNGPGAVSPKTLPSGTYLQTFAVK